MAIIADFSNGQTKIYTKSMYQHDKGQILRFVGVHLPPSFEVHFSNSKDGGTASTVIGENYFAAIPDAYFATGEYIYAWAYDRHEESFVKVDYSVEDEILTEEHLDPIKYTRGTTVYEVVIPIIRRSIDITMPVPGLGENVNEYSISDESLIITGK